MPCGLHRYGPYAAHGTPPKVHHAVCTGEAPRAAFSGCKFPLEKKEGAGGGGGGEKKSWLATILDHPSSEGRTVIFLSFFMGMGGVRTNGTCTSAVYTLLSG